MRQVKLVSTGPMIRNLGLFFTAILVVSFAVFGGQFPDRNDPIVPALSSKYYYDKGITVYRNLSGRVGEQALKTILKTELPVLAIADEKSGSLPPEGSPVIKLCLNLLAGVQLADPLSYLKAEIPMMDVTPVTADSFDETGFDEITVKPSQNPIPDQPLKQPVVENKIKSSEPLIALYNTHTSETFELTDGLAHLKGKAGGVAIVAGEIQKVIQEQYGIAVTNSAVIHDMSFNKSYAESQKTVIQLLRENPKLEMLFDIHRDGSLTREQSLTKVNGQPVAKILIVVGTDARADNPKWRENLEFARKIAAKMDNMYPGLSRAIFSIIIFFRIGPRLLCC
ncbi:MAG: stage II sporulation protein P [Firmicutes bacterium]|nr:stage II sporulation protein P [Bacillota bacterium]